MRIWFLARQSLPFSPRNLRGHRIGGSEIALYCVARGLAALGHDVVVLNHCGADAGLHDGVRYLDLTRDQDVWQKEVRARPADVLVLFRRMLDVTARIRSKVRVFWAHDYQGVSVSETSKGIGQRLAIAWRQATGPLFHKRVDQVFVVSQFMADLFYWLFRTPPEKLVVMPNGVDASLFTGSAPARQRHRFIHTSVPERGLAQLLQDIFPEIRRAHPAAELHITSYQPLEAYQRFAGEGVHFRGFLTKADLAQLLRESSLMFYPSNFEEMGAIAVLEAMAAGTPAVTSALGVLPELTGNGVRGIAVQGQPGTGAFARAFVRATLELLNNEEGLQRMRSAAREYALTLHNWDRIVQQWDQTLRALAA